MSMKTPGVYIREVNAFPPSIVEVATAVPAFIGYTEKAEEKGQSLNLRPRRIGSMAEFERFFGGAPTVAFAVAAAPATGSTTPAQGLPLKLATSTVYVRQTSPDYRLYRGMRHFFQNGGGACVIVSVGTYGASGPAKADLLAGIAALEKEQESTMVVVPEAISLSTAACADVQNAMLLHCQDEKQRNRFAILDVQGGDRGLNGSDDPVAEFRLRVLKTGADFAAAYYPYLDTSLIDENELGLAHIETNSLTVVKTVVTGDAQATPGLDALLPPAQPADKKAADAGDAEASTEKSKKADKKAKDDGTDADKETDADAAKPAPEVLSVDDVHKALYNGSPDYRSLLGEMRRQLGRVAPSPAMAGLYTLVDGSRGVWKAPANIGVAGVIAPAVEISHADQEGLNVSPQGKSINAIRSFIGEGVMVWGARTLDGNSLDWRYINVRRTMIMIEQSCKLAAKQLVFEPNVANTWVTIKSMIGNYLTTVWKRGGLAGAVPEDAFTVLCGLGETMAPEDILEGVLKVTVLVAVSRPAEFIEITFQQQMQKS